MHIRNHKVTVYYIVICIFTVTIPLQNLTSRIEYIAHASFSQTYVAIQRKGAGVLAVRRLQLGEFITSSEHAWHPGKARGGGFNRFAHSAGPILVKRDQGNNDQP